MINYSVFQSYFYFSFLGNFLFWNNDRLKRSCSDNTGRSHYPLFSIHQCYIINNSSKLQTQEIYIGLSVSFILCHFITYVDSCNYDCNQDIECTIIIKFSLMLFFCSHPSPLCPPLNSGNHEYAFLDYGFIIFKMHKWNHTLYDLLRFFFFTQNNAILSSRIILLLYEVLFTIFFHSL